MSSIKVKLPKCPKCGSPRVTVWYGANIDGKLGDIKRGPEVFSAECRIEECRWSAKFSTDFSQLFGEVV